MFLGDSNIIWKESNRVISAGTTIIRKDPRLSLEDGYNLRIDDLQETDSGIKLTNTSYIWQKMRNCFGIFSGEYVCEVETYGSPLHQSSRLEILGKSSFFWL